MHENDIFMDENENFATGTIYSPQKLPCVVGLYTTSCRKCSPIIENIWAKNFIFMHDHFIFMHEMKCSCMKL